ncbi:MAG: hypothetical protein HFE63_02125 [Clostridiales bacterium]|nr:hypothetical protein [Clostridiales bacterium]
MLCQKCKKNNASVYYKENINGKVTEYSLCPDCAAELEKNGIIKFEKPFERLGDSMFDFSPLFSGFLGGLDRALSGGSHTSAKEPKHCPLCGSTFADIAHSGHIGCPECYATFENELAATINQLHGSAKPTGRIPKRFGEKQNREQEIAKLKAEMKTAIETQEFERAAELRDKLKALEAPEAAKTSDSENNSDTNTSEN